MKSAMHYKVEIDYNEADECFIATVPELDACKADGATRADALEMLEELVEEYLKSPYTI